MNARSLKGEGFGAIYFIRNVYVVWYVYANVDGL